MDTEALSRLAGQVQSWVAQDPLMKEANVKLRVVQPLLALLEWDVSRGDVEMEWQVQMGTKAVAVDYSLMVDRKPVAFVEAKGFESNLKKEEEQQVISYGKVDEVRWCVLTNGKRLRIYDASEAKDPEDCLVAEIDLSTLGSHLEEIRLLSKSSIMSQETETAVRFRRGLQTAAKNLESSRAEVVTAVSRVLGKYMQELPAERVRDMADRGFAAIQSAVFQAGYTTPARPIPAGPEKSHAKPIKEEEVPATSRRQLQGNPDSTVLVCPAKIERGLEFFFKYQAWGFIRANRPPALLALYVTSPHSKVLYVGEVEVVTPPLSTRAEVRGISEEDKETFSPGKRVIWLKKATIRRLVDPIPAGRVGSQPQSPRYTTLAKFISARDTTDLW